MNKSLCKPSLYIALLFGSFIAQIASAQTSGKAAVLQCEHLLNPIGIDSRHPRLSWLMTDDRQGAAQTAYQIIAGTDSAAVNAGKGDSWLTTKISSAANLVSYQGKALQPFTKYYWRVQLWDQTGKKLHSSAIASFETGMMDMRNWKGSWISDNKGIAVNPAPYFRHTFKVAKQIRSARAYIA